MDWSMTMNKNLISHDAPHPAALPVSRQDELRQQLNQRLLWDLLISEHVLPGQHLLWIEDICITMKGSDV